MTTPEWFYQTDGQTHGPFTNNDMLSWYQQGYLQANLPLSRDGRAFHPLGEWFPNLAAAFQPGAAANPGTQNNQNYGGGRQYQNQYNAAPAQTYNQPQAQTQQPAATQPSAETERWYFLDMSGEVQGPFTNNQMLEWHKDGFFEETLQIYDTVRNPQEWGWKSLKEYFPQTSQAFGGATAAPRQEEVPERFRFPTMMPQPPPYKGVPKVYPSERNEGY